MIIINFFCVLCRLPRLTIWAHPRLSYPFAFRYYLASVVDWIGAAGVLESFLYTVRCKIYILMDIRNT